MILSNSVRQRYRADTAGKTPTELQRELRKRGVKRFCRKRKSQSRNDVSRQTRCKTKQGVYEMSNEYRDAQIVKHALQYYINRPNASELDLKREQKVLDKVTNQVKDMQENWDIKNKEER